MTRFRPQGSSEDRAAAEREIDDELSFHRDRTVEELEARGLSDAEAAAEAGRRFGPARHRRALVHMELRRQSGDRRRTSMEVFRTSVRAVVRGIRRSPGFTLGVVTILTLGLGVNAITFALVDRLILSGPSAIKAPDELRRVVVHSSRRGVEITTTELGYLDYRDFLNAGQLAGVAGESETPLLFGAGDTAERINGRLVTASYFSLLGVTPAAGRFFTADESEKDGARLVVLSHAFWQRRFGGDAGVIGQVVPIESHRYTVIGVSPQYFTGTAVTRVDVFLPLEAASDEQVEGPWRSIRNFRWMGAIVRLAPGASDKAAADEITAGYRQGYAKEPDADPRAWLELTSLNPVRGATAAGDLGVAALVGGVALFVLLIAFANVANLFLARSLRRREFLAVRLALGGTRARLLAEQAVEGALLALLGAAAAVLVAAAGTRPAQLLLFPEVHWLETAVNVRALLFVSVCAVIGGALAASLPTWQAGRANIVSWLRVGGQRVSRTRTQGLMLILQGALSILLLVGAGLFVRSLVGIRSQSLGIDAGRLLVVSSLRGEAPPRADFRTSFRAIVDKIPGVERTTRAGGTLPFVSSWGVKLRVPGLADRPTVPDGGPYINSVEPGYFETVGTRIVEGRPFHADDRAGAPGVAIVNQSMARLYWPGESAIGKCLQIGGDDAMCSTVVGVAENTRRSAILERESLLYYVPIDQGPADLRGGRLIVRIADDDSSVKARVAETIRREALLLEPGLRYVTARSLDDVIAPQLRTWQLGAGLFSAFGLLALAVSAVGLYSVVAFDVEGRRREIGVRAALGAPSSAILRLIVGDGLRLSAGGLAAGLALAWLLAPLASELLYGVAPQDAAVFAGASAALIAAAVVASAIPAYRAARIDPTEALKEQ